MHRLINGYLLKVVEVLCLNGDVSLINSRIGIRGDNVGDGNDGNAGTVILDLNGDVRRKILVKTEDLCCVCSGNGTSEKVVLVGEGLYSEIRLDVFNCKSKGKSYFVKFSGC